MEEIKEALDRRAGEGLLRRLRPIANRERGRIISNGRKYIDLSSNDYLGLSGHPKLVRAAKEAAEKYGTSSSASRLLSGDLEINHKLEESVAAFKNKESALVFNSGYQANVGILSALYGKGDAVFSDRLNHASIIDGIVLSGAKLFRFRHNDANHLEEILKKERTGFKKALIVTETIFSMDGDRADIKAIVDIKDRYRCQVMVDEAHATGIYGKNGSGLVEEEGLSDRIDLIMGTFSKTLGSFGAYLASSKSIIDYLINTSRSFIYSTALPPATIAASLAAIDLIREEPERRIKLLKSAARLREELKKKGFDVRGSSQIVPVIIGDNQKTLDISEALMDKGYWVLPIRPPTVPKGEARLRFSINVHHNKEILDRLINDLTNARIQIYR